jgi:hypothetical protein
MKARPIKSYVITPHASLEMERRGLDEESVRDVLAAPGQRLGVRPGRDVLQSKVSIGAPLKTYVVRVFVDVDRRPAEVVTVYRSSKITKYWKEPQ